MSGHDPFPICTILQRLLCCGNLAHHFHYRLMSALPKFNLLLSSPLG